MENTGLTMRKFDVYVHEALPMFMLALGYKEKKPCWRVIEGYTLKDKKQNR